MSNRSDTDYVESVLQQTVVELPDKLPRNRMPWQWWIQLQNSYIMHPEMQLKKRWGKFIYSEEYILELIQLSWELEAE